MLSLPKKEVKSSSPGGRPPLKKGSVLLTSGREKVEFALFFEKVFVP